MVAFYLLVLGGSKPIEARAMSHPGSPLASMTGTPVH